MILPQGLTHSRADQIVQLLLGVAVDVGDTHELGGGAVHRRNNSSHGPPLVKGVVVGVVTYDHCARHGDFDGPGLAAELAVHLYSNFCGDAHQALGLVQHRGGDALAWRGLLDDALLLDSSVMVSLSRK